MKKLLLITCYVMLWIFSAEARHIKGGEISYEYLGPGASPNMDRFMVTLKLFLECNAAGQQLDEFANVGIFRIADQLPVLGSPFNFPLITDEFINIRAPNPCIVNPSPVCYRLRVYVAVIELAKDPQGYTAVFQRCCRIENLSNLSPNNNIGSSYTCNIHSSTNVPAGEKNSSPSFEIKDTVLICQNRPFQLDFGAVDPDGDMLTYEFAPAFSAPGGGGGGIVDPVAPAQISFVSYAPGFSGAEPLGPGVTIDPSTGLIAGIAPVGGDYVLSVIVREWRNGKIISDHRKDFNIKVDERCDLAAALLKPTYSSCDDFTFTFRNEAPPSSLIKSYLWNVGVPGAPELTDASPSFTYADTGAYKIKLVINQGDQCSDSAEARLFVYPGFDPGFEVTGSCFQNAFTFLDTTRSRYGSVNSWSWNFGDITVNNDTNNISNPQWKYPAPGFKQVVFRVASDKGCQAEVSKIVEVRDKPLITLPFKDTLICNIDSLRLGAVGGGLFTWSPGYNLLDAGSPNPLVYPKTSTWYHVMLNENGCINTDSIHVRVVDQVTLFTSSDTTICLNDSAQLFAGGDGLKYSWSEAATLDDPFSRSPVATPTATTRYMVTATIGGCDRSAGINVLTVPYPMAYAGRDTTVCFEDTAYLSGSITGNRFIWSPANTLANSTNLNPVAFPRRTTVYTLSVYDNLGCPKPGTDDVVVNVQGRIEAFAGNDTAIVTGQPLQLVGSGSELIEWSPPTYLNRNDIASPVVQLNENMTYVMKAYTQEGCFSLDTINIKVFKSSPDIFVPNAFTPLGRNPLFRPTPVGIRQFQYFRVFNRYGQLMYQTSEVGRGWDGNFGGKPQPTGAFVWMVSGIDYTGRPIQKKGTALLIR